MHREVRSIFQDSRGFMWFGTPIGLNRFDGYDFKSFRVEDGLAAPNIFIVAEDLEGYLWLVGFESNLIKSITLLHVETNEIISFPEKFGSDLPFNLEDLLHQFITSPDGGIYFTDKRNKTLISYYPDSGFRVVPIEFQGSLDLLFFSSPTSIWANLSKQSKDKHYQDTIVELDLQGRTLHQYAHEGYLGADKFCLKDDELWFFDDLPDLTGNYYRIDKNRKKWTPENDPLKIDETLGQMRNLLKLQYHSKSKTIIGLDYFQRAIMDPQKGIIIDLDERFPILKGDISVGDRGCFMDNKERIWMGGNFGVYLLNVQESPFTRYLHKNLSKERGEQMGLACREMIEYKDEIYVATEGKTILKLKDPLPTVTQKPLFPFLKSNNGLCWSLSLDPDGGLLAGCYPEFYKLEPETGMSSQVKKDFENDVGIWSIHQQRNGKIWLGNWFGLLIYNPDRKVIEDFKDYNGFDDLRDAAIIDIYEDNNGILWLISSKGLFSLEDNAGITGRYWSGGRDEYYLPADNFHHLFRDEDGIFWLATGGQGLIRWDRQKQTHKQFTTLDGLPDNVIYAIYPDEFNRLWLSSDYGIIQFDRKTFKSKSYLTRDGISHEEFNRVSHFQDKAGNIHFGGLNGVTAFHPRDFEQVDHVDEESLLQITEFFQFDGESNKLLDKTAQLLQTGQIQMLPGDRFFLIRFSVLSYDDIKNIRYAYKIEGYDDNWTEQKENSVRLSRLPYGKYNLRIKGQSADGVWSENEISILLSVVTPFYLQSWFFVLSAFLLTLLGYGLYRYDLKHKLSLAETKRVKDLDTLKTKLYTYISHEFRTPLTVILGISDSIKGQPKSRELIQRNGRQLLRLVNELLDLSKLDAGSIKLNLKRGDLVSYLNYLTESFFSMAMEKKLRLTFDSEEKEIIMDFDEDKIQQIIYNLVSNAIKFTEENGVVVVFVRKQEMEGQEFVQIRVKDSGRGIPENDLENIFDRFYQIERKSSGNRGGSGIGLALTKELIDLMDGSISVESELGKGTAFIILLPIHKSEQVEKVIIPDLPDEIMESIPEEPFPQNKFQEFESEFKEDYDQPQLLIIEDNKDVAYYVRSCVEDQYRVHLAENGNEGIQLALEIIPDIIISDVMMPEKDGYEVTKTLKMDERTSHIPIILLTAKAHVDDRVKGLELGADAYLMKPFHKRELLVRLRKLVELRKQLQDYYSNFSGQPVQQEKVLTKDEQFIQKFHDFIQKEIGNPHLSTDDLCKTLSLSQAQLYRKVKALTGKTPALFIRSIRLAKAMTLLQEGQLNISEVAYEVGFADPNYFSRVFAKEFGFSPSSISNN